MDNYTGKRLDGRYEIIEVIGVGGMAVVYKAYDRIDDRTVAVKILKDEYLASEEFRRRFKNESKAIAVLSHPNIVKVYNVNYGDRLQYIVMEYVEGITLKEYIEQQGRLGIKETVYFSIQILRALQHAHDKGIVHRDIKPQNIMLLSNGVIKVMDFGIARFSYSDTKTMSDSAIGSVHYISPEQARGYTTDERTDIYSVGVVMYEMLTGKLPFTSENSVSVALMQLQSQAKSPREINPSIPVGLEQIVSKAMEKDTGLRYQSAAEMLNDIEQFQSNPNVRFNHNAFVDKEPTKYVNTKQVSKVVSQSAAKVPSHTNEDINTDEKAIRKTSISKGTTVAIGVIVGLAILAVMSFFVLRNFTGFVSGGDYVVPSLVGKNYEADVKNNNSYSNFVIEPVYMDNSNLSDGVIFNQEPTQGKKVSKSSNKITVYVVKNSAMLVVPDVYDLNWEQAETLLKSKGFKVNKLPYASVAKEFGTVIKTIPERDTQVESGATITVYYASDEEMIAVPNVIGYDRETAKALIESVNLVVGDIEEEDSELEAGLISSQSPSAGDKVMADSKVKLFVSNGKGKKVTAQLKITLPPRDTKATIEVFVNNELDSQKKIILDGAAYYFEVKGSEKDSVVKVRIDNDDYYSCVVDFTASPPTVTDGKYSSLTVFKKKLPDVKGKKMSDAELALKNAGFYNIKVEYEVVYTENEDGVVLSQSPAPSSDNILSLDTYSTDTFVTIVVGQMDGINSNPDD
ncbi:MAG: Stk1 family PASTA domain-containing Ser/Thr kinase [Clostridiales bacterium]|nr:Stk1 family PASTA domain-containing Ser/Thr kinase [Clostridiales bacterium]